MSILINEFCDIININNNVGSIIEFGTGSGVSTKIIADRTYNGRTIYTFDGFQGLPSTSKVIPQGTGWNEGNLFFDKTKTDELLSAYNNVIITKVMTTDLNEPIDYGIDLIIGVNLDLDLYEGTLDGLRFINKCSWKNIVLRFDDWGCYSHQVAAEVDEHEKAAFYDWIRETKYEFVIDDRLLQLSEGRQCIVYVNR